MHNYNSRKYLLSVVSSVLQKNHALYYKSLHCKIVLSRENKNLRFSVTEMLAKDKKQQRENGLNYSKYPEQKHQSSYWWQTLVTLTVHVPRGVTGCPGEGYTQNE